jgi:hypothetical protein
VRAPCPATTHQPGEQLVALRAIPGMIVLRPADANEVSEAYRVIMQLKRQPACLVLGRQALAIFDRRRYAAASGLARSAYVMADPKAGDPQSRGHGALTMKSALSHPLRNFSRQVTFMRRRQRRNSRGGSAYLLASSGSVSAYGFDGEHSAGANL